MTPPMPPLIVLRCQEALGITLCRMGRGGYPRDGQVA